MCRTRRRPTAILVLAAIATMAGAPAANSRPAPLSFALTSAYSMPFGPDGSLGSGIAASEWSAPGWDFTFACRAGVGSSPFFVGGEVGLSWVPRANWRALGVDPFTLWPAYAGLAAGAIIRTSIWHAGVVAGIELAVLGPVGVRGFANASYSFRISSSGTRSGAPLVGLGTEIYWNVAPSFGLCAGAQYRSFFDYSDVAFGCGLALNVPR